MAREEFFRPICEMFEDEDSVLAISDLSLIDMGNVLSLTELCLIKMKQVGKSESSKYAIKIVYLLFSSTVATTSNKKIMYRYIKSDCIL